MTSFRHHTRFIPGFLCLGIILVLVLLVSGCTQQAPIPPVVTPTMNTTPAPTGMTTPMAADGKKMVTYTEADNGKTGDIAQNSRFAVQLAENPTTGFMWNATLSPGLELQSTDFRQSRPAAPGMVGVGGTRTWIILANNTGNQNFSAIYRRSWEPVTGNETAYSMNIRVITI